MGSGDLTRSKEIEMNQFYSSVMWIGTIFTSNFCISDENQIQYHNIYCKLDDLDNVLLSKLLLKMKNLKFFTLVSPHFHASDLSLTIVRAEGTYGRENEGDRRPHTQFVT